MNIKKQFKDGLITNNPVLVQLLGMCSTMAITTMFFNGIGMGISVLIILTCCNVVISAMRKIIPNDIRIAVFVVIIAGFVTIVDLLLQAYVPALSDVSGRVHPPDRRQLHHHRPCRSILPRKTASELPRFDGIFQGLGYTIVLTIMCIIREFLGSGSFGKGIINTINGIGTGNGLQIFPEEFGAKLLTMPFGGFLTLGCLIALMQYALRKSAEKKEKEGNK